jgi:hypothetical protein
MLTAEMKASRAAIWQQRLSCYGSEGKEFLHNIVTADETWVHHYEPETKRQSTEYHEGSPAKKISKPKLWQENSLLQFFGMQMVLFT